MEPPVSVPVAASAIRDATAEAEPPEDPPGTSGIFCLSSLRQGFSTAPK